MADRRKRPSIPAITPYNPIRPQAGRAYDREVVGGEPGAPTSRKVSGRELQSYRTREQELRRAKTDVALQMALAGNDSRLLPYRPTATSDPARPRTMAAGYDSRSRTLRVRFRGPKDGDHYDDGVGYEYYNVPPNVWRNFRRVQSPGRLINRTLNNYPYAPADW
jgi:hypothetical protein